MKKHIVNIFIVLFLVGIVVSGNYVYRTLSAEQKSRESVEALASSAVRLSVSPEEAEEKETAPISVDFDALKAANEDIVAWLYCEDTVINYPVAQSDDNEYYLHRLTDGSYNAAGTLFLDCRNSADFSDGLSIIYGHNMKNDTMFGTLKDYTEQSHYDAHPTLYLLTPEKNYRVDLLAGFVADSLSDTYEIADFAEKREDFLQESLRKSTFLSTAEAEDEDPLILLSTCSYEYENARYVALGRMQEVAR